MACKRIQTGYISTFQEAAMTHKQRLIYSILIAVSVLAIMLGLSWLQNAGMISEKTFQFVAIGVAVIVVVINGVMRRKVKP
jgi:flagellar biosynthesis protein FliQ